MPKVSNANEPAACVLAPPLAPMRSARGGFVHQPSGHWALHRPRAFSNLKTCLAGTYHGAEPKDLQRYTAAFVVRFNRRNPPMASFHSLLGIAHSIQPCPAAKISQPDSTE
jgi:hypothetical protein